jgi:hypothetical protein
MDLFDYKPLLNKMNGEDESLGKATFIQTCSQFPDRQVIGSSIDYGWGRGTESLTAFIVVQEKLSPKFN